MITLDTSAFVALLDTKDRHHGSCAETMERDPGPLLLSVAALAEIAWLLESRFAPDVESAFLEDLRQQLYVLDWQFQDVARIADLTRRYHDLKLGVTDAAVIACAERNGGKVLTIDRRHFPVVARGEGTITVLPELP